MKSESYNYKVQIIFIGLCFCILSSYAQVTFHRTIGGAGRDEAYCIKNTSDNGFIVTGYTNSFGEGGNDIYVVKITDDGSFQWSKTYGGIGDEIAYSLEQTSDGGYLITGTTNSVGAGQNDIFLIKTDSSGNIEWNKTYGDINGYTEEGYSVKATNDGGFIIAGSVGSGLLIKVDATGNIQWNKYYQQTYTDNHFIMDVFSTDDGNYIVAGTREGGGGNTGDFLLMKLDNMGSVLWSKTYGGSNFDGAVDFTQTDDGGYIIVGETYSFGNSPVYIVKTDSVGNMLWDKILDDASDIETCRSIECTSDGGYIITGGITGASGIFDAYLLKINSSGSIQWSKRYENFNISIEGYSAKQSLDNGYIFVINDELYGFGNFDFHIIKTNGNGISGCYESSISGFSSGNPATVVLNTSIITNTLSLSVDSGFVSHNIWNFTANICAEKIVRGRVINETDTVFSIDSSDYGLPYRIIRADPGPVYGISDNTGRYTLYMDAGTFSVSNIDNDPFRDIFYPASPFSYNINLSPNDTSFDNINFGLKTTVFCPLMTVDITGMPLRPCMNSTYSVSYCNNGTLPAENATVEITLDQNMTYYEGTGNLISQNGNNLLFDIGTVQPGECSSFNFVVSIACNNSLSGSTMCVDAHIYPDSSCFPVDTAWDHSSVAVEGYCLNDSLACFTVFNTGDTGTGDMQDTSEYRIYENNILVYIGTFQIAGGDSLEVCWPANGNTIRLEADQRPGHPGNSHPQDNIELCGDSTDAFVTGQITLVSQDDLDDFIETDCHIVTGSYDPNEKQVSPAGLTTIYHYIDSTDVPEYIVYFQNTGTDTAFKVVIRDTLSPYLDITSIQPGAASHIYLLEILGSDVLQWTFNNIMLPDSNVNEPQSHGFVKYKINQQHGNSLGTIIENSAGIMFDFNPPVITNTVFNTIGNLDSLTTMSCDSGLLIIFVTDTATQGNNDGSINITVTNGLPPYTYSWSTGDNTEDIDSLPAGFYSVVVADSWGCTDSITIELPEATSVTSTANKQISLNIYPNPFTETTTVIFKNFLPGIQNANLKIIDLTGRIIKFYIVKQGETNLTLHANEIGTGMFFVQLVLEKEIVITRKIVIY
ncbi:MAG: T9SS type A sorting domain-containing protein [Bacteroidia bacterium]|nr:T9SS type A sorting domain-containing protein [Bacteroidia bacterium]